LIRQVTEFHVGMAKKDPDLRGLAKWLQEIPATPLAPGLPRSLPFWKRVFA
jgi:hypothetical protein